MPSNFKKEKIRDKAYLRWVRSSMSCVLSNFSNPDPAHVGGSNKGIATKTGDDCVVPLRRDWHDRQHQIGEISFWREAFRIMDRHMLLFFVRAGAREIYRRYKAGVPASDIFKE